MGASAAPGSLAGVAVDDASVWVGRELSAKAYRLDPSTAATAATVEFSTAIGSPLVTIASNAIVASVALPAALDGVAIRGRSAWFAGSKATGDQPDVVRVDY